MWISVTRSVCFCSCDAGVTTGAQLPVAQRRNMSRGHLMIQKWSLPHMRDNMPMTRHLWGPWPLTQQVPILMYYRSTGSQDLHLRKKVQSVLRWWFMLVQIEPQLAEQNIYSGCSNICKLLLTVCASGVQVLLMYSLSLSLWDSFSLELPRL